MSSTERSRCPDQQQRNVPGAQVNRMSVGEELAGLLRRAGDAQNSIEKSSQQHTSAAQQELQAFQYLQIIRHLLAAANR